MPKSVAIVGAGVSGLTCGVLFAERGHRTAIFADEVGQQTTSGAAAAKWFPYDAEPAQKVIAWALETYQVVVDLAGNPHTAVSMLELTVFRAPAIFKFPIGHTRSAPLSCRAESRHLLLLTLPFLEAASS